MSYEDFNNICRLCLQNMFPKILIFSGTQADNDNQNFKELGAPIKSENSIAEMIEFCTGIVLSPEDELPKFICANCTDDLLKCSTFLRKCISSKDVLEEILKQHQQQHEVECNDNLRDPLDVSEYNNNLYDDDDKNGPVEAAEAIKEELELRNIEKCVEECLNSTLPTNDDYEFTIIEILDEENSVEDSKIEEDEEENTQSEDLKSIEKKKSVKKPRKISQKKASEETKNVDHSNNDKIKKERVVRQCQICGKMFRCIASHMLLHTREKKYKCSICGKAFRVSCNLKEHMYNHLNSRPFKCKYCDRAFNYKHSLKVHEIHHTGERNYECNLCGRKYAQASTLRYHKKAHNQIRQHKCDQCGKEFILKYDLKKHYFIHTGEKPYECNDCGKRFNNSGGLWLHKKTHTKSISFECNKCNLGFVYKATYSNHLRKFHGNGNEGDEDGNRENLN